ncbi:MAG: MFS transporter [Nocardioides sp.]
MNGASPAAVPRVQRQHRLIVAAFGISSVGDGLRIAALPLVALTITTNPLEIAGLAVAGRLPWLVVALVSGAIADRVDRRRLMIAVDVCRAAAIASVIVVLTTSADRIWYLYALSLVLGIGETLFESATQGLLPQVVPPEELGRANGQLFTLTFVFNGLLGPMIGGWLFSLGRLVPLVGDMFSFLASAVVLTIHRVKAGPVAARSGGDVDRDSSLVALVREGLSWVAAHPAMRSLVMVSVAANFIQSAILSVLALFATGPAGVPIAAFGLLLASSGLGGFAGGWLSSRAADRLGIHRVLFPAIASGVPLYLLMAWIPNPYILGAGLAINAFMGVMVSVQTAVFRQQIVPNRLLSRVSSVGQFFSFGFAIPLGALYAGIVANQWGTSAVYWSAGVITGVVCVIVWPSIRPARLAEAVERMREQGVSETGSST